MRAETSCHLVDLTVLRTSVSLRLGYLEAFAESDPRIADRCRFSALCRLLDSGVEPAWQSLQRQIESAPSEKRIFGFTNFFWNRAANLELAKRIKTVFPGALVVFGGNDVTDQGETLLAAGSPVDVVVNGEGEAIFANLLARYLDSPDDLQAVNGLSFRDESGGIVTTSPQPRIDDLNNIPSPLLKGCFSSRSLSTSVDVAYEFSRGCPFKCAFCYWGAAIGTKTRRFSRDRIREDLDFLISSAGPVIRIWMADANFGMSDADVETAYLLAGLVQKYRKRVFLVTNWAKNTSKRVIEAATVLHRHGIITSVTLSAQSLNDEVLKIGNRKNIPFDYYRQLQEEFRALGIPTYTELIFGMPGESYDSFVGGVARVIAAGGTPVLHPLLLLNNTEYNNPRMRELYKIESRLMRYMGHGVSEADVLIGHTRLSYEDWLRGMALRLAVPLFYCGVLKFLMRRLHEVHGLTYEEMLNRLVRYCMEGRVESHGSFRRIFLHHMDSWNSPGTATPVDDRALIRESQFGEGHYRALIKVMLRDSAAAGPLVDEFVQALEAASGGGTEEVTRWIEYQKLILTAMSQVISRGAETVQTTLTAPELQEYAGYSVAQDGGPWRELTIRPDYKALAPDEFIFRILYGSVDTLQMFATCPGTALVASA